MLLHERKVSQAPHPHHEKLIQIGGEDGGELQPLQQGHAAVVGLSQHPPVKLQPG
ncbi:hypothetical protein SDC9_74214 [bioreactor metagenome]|uniref:Uncharacterized protein n=1 Tax=bioreactor metagenome TaxID=1076179 RepID=A0A644YII7_9ZZZZ